MKTFALGDPHGNYRGLLQVLEKSSFNKKEDKLIVLGDVVDGWPETVECIEELLSIDNLIVIEGNHDCLDEETEVFTRRGWLKYQDITLKDEVIGMNHFNNLSSWQKINKIIIKESDHLNCYSDRQLDIAITDSHRILQKNNNIYSYTTLKEGINTKGPIIPIGIKTSNSPYDITNAEIKLVAWILTDGGISQNGYITIYQSKEENLEHIENILKELNLTYSHKIRNRATTKILGKVLKSINPAHEYKILATSSHEITKKLIRSKKEIPSWCYNLSIAQLELFIKEIIRGDGSWYRGSTKLGILYGTNEFLSNIQPLFNIAGFSARVAQSNRNDFRLNISKRDTGQIRTDGSHKVVRKIGTFKVWCLSVPYTNFLVRRNGKSYFTGNCWAYEWLTFGLDPWTWTEQGGQATIDSYLKNPEKKQEHLEKYFSQMNPYYIDDLNNVYVHGGYTSKEGLGHDRLSTYTWDRTLWEKAKSAKEQVLNMTKMYNKVFIGHTAISKNIPQKCGNVWNLDANGGWSGKLCIMNTETEEYFLSDFTKNLYLEKGR